MSKTFKRIWNIFTTVLVALVVVAAILLAGVRLFGLQVFSVLSGSMEPTYHTGSLIYVKKVDPFTVEPGQVLTFMLDESTVATHRVVAVVPDENDPSTIRFRTKGDANDAEDGGLVHYKNVIGTPVFTIPKLGYLANYVQHPPGMYVAISAGAVLLLLVFIPDIFADDDKKKKAGARKKGVRTTSRKDADFDPNEPVPAEQAERLRQAAEALLPEEELQALDARLAEGPLTRGEYRTVRRRMKQLSEEIPAQQ